MNVNLTPELEEFVRKKVGSGLYNNQSEVVREGLRLLAEQDRLRDAHPAGLREALVESLQQADRGELLDGEQVVEEIGEFLRARRATSENREA